MRNDGGRGVPWAAEAKAELERLWAVREGDKPLSTAEIGRRMGFTKNAIIGAAGRMGLPSRPSPIKRAEGAAAPAQHKRARPTPRPLPPLASLAAPPPDVVACVIVPPVPLPVPVEPVALPPAPVLARPRPSSQCCWPIGEPGEKAFRFCDAPAETGRSYCPAHCKVAYVKHVPGGVFQLGPAPGFGG